MDFSNKLKQLRLMLGYTQAQMADFLGITARGYRNYELGAREPELSVLIKLADRFNVSLDELVGRNFPKDSLMNSK
jgi:transcriptional regulator with XRE-family HTH domain